jgi:dihydrodipicolinate synthase/N-acetylneuraminate lyase
MGLCISLNLQAGGLTRTTNGVPACWDVLNDASSNGVAVGDRQTAFAAGTYRTCAQAGTDGALLPSPKDVIASPAWIEEYVDQAIADGGFPFVLFWNDPTATASTSDAWAEVYYERADFVSAFDNAINAGLAATAAPWRTPK